MSTLVGAQLAPQRPIPRNEEIKQFLYGTAVIGETTRFRQLDRFEAHYACTQYAHHKHDWWGYPADMTETISPEIQVPYGFTQPALALSVRAKRPTAPYALCKVIVDRFTGLLFSEARRPDVSWEGDPDTEDFILAIIEQCRFWAKWREARTMGGALGSVLVTAHVRAGRFSCETHNPKHLQIVWRDRRALIPAAVLKLYRYPVEEDIVDPKTRMIKGTQIVEYLYRRIITEHEDTVYKPVRMEKGMPLDLSWVPEATVEHDLGFFPGVWVQNLPVLEQEDGDPDCAGAWQNFDTIDRLLSQMNKGVLVNLDPTLKLKVDPKVVAAQGGAVQKGSDNALYVGADGDAGYVEITGSGIEVGAKFYEILKQNTLDVCRCVLVDPEKISGAAQSAKAIEYLYAPMLEKADDLRGQYGDLGVLPLLLIMEKIARVYGERKGTDEEGRELRYGLDLPPRADGSQRALGKGGYARLKWGPYFAPTENDKNQAISNIVAAKAGGIIDQETAVKHGAPIFEVRDADAMFKKVQEEQEAEMERALAGIGGGVPPGDTTGAPPETGPPAGGGGKP